MWCFLLPLIFGPLNLTIRVMRSNMGLARSQLEEIPHLDAARNGKPFNHGHLQITLKEKTFLFETCANLHFWGFHDSFWGKVREAEAIEVHST